MMVRAADREERRPRRIVIVANSLEGGGAERVVSTLCNEWCANEEARAFAELSLILLDAAAERYSIDKSVKVIRLSTRGGLTESSIKLFSYLRNERPDAILSFLTRANICSIIAGRIFGVPVVVSERVNTKSHFALRGWTGFASAAMVRALYHRADSVVAVSKGVAQELTSTFNVPPSILHVIPNSYDAASLRERCASSACPADDRFSPYFVAVGRLAPAKDYATMIDAFARLNSNHRLVILGEGPEYQALKQRSIQLGISNRVFFLGFVSEPFGIIGRACAYVSTSRAEGFPNAAAEAMALGVPVVHSDCPSGPAELLGSTGAWQKKGIEVCDYGIMVKTGSVDSVLAGMQAVLDPAEAERLGIAGPKRIAQYSHTEFITQYLNVLRAHIK